MSEFKKKYLKYKIKYIQLRGSGSGSVEEPENTLDSKIESDEEREKKLPGILYGLYKFFNLINEEMYLDEVQSILKKKEINLDNNLNKDILEKDINKDIPEKDIINLIIKLCNQNDIYINEYNCKDIFDIYYNKIYNLHHCGLLLENTTPYMKNNKYIVNIAIKQNVLALEFASDNLKKNKYFLIDAVKQNGMALKFASNYIKNDVDVVTIAVKQNGMALEFASTYLQDNEDIVQNAINTNMEALQCASKRVKKIINPSVNQDK